MADKIHYTLHPHLGPVLEPVSQYSPLSSPPPLTMALPRLVQPQRSCVSAPSDYAGLFHQVRHASLEMNLQATMPEDRENGESAQDDCLMDADQPENSTDSDTDHTPAEDFENLPDVLKCEFCGKRGFARTFLRSKCFCSMTCQKIERKEDEDPPGPMMTRLRLQAKKDKDQDREREQSRVKSSSRSLTLVPHSGASVLLHQLFIRCHDIASEFCSQEIDGQALLLLTEDHLMSTTNIRLGPVLKICAQISALKEN